MSKVTSAINILRKQGAYGIYSTIRNKHLLRLYEAERQRFNRLVAFVLNNRPGPLPNWSARPRRVLFLRHDKIGDMIMSTGILRALAESHPAITLDVLASPSNAAVLENLSFVHEVIPFAAKSPPEALQFAWSLRHRQYDAVVDGLVLTQELSTAIAFLALGCGARWRIGMWSDWRQGDCVYTHTVAPPAHTEANAVEYLAQLAAPFGVAPDEVPHPLLRLSDAEAAWAERAWCEADARQRNRKIAGERMRLIVNISAGHPARRWGDAQFIAAIRYVQAARPSSTVIVIGDPAERAAIEAVARASWTASPATKSVRAAFALVARSDMVLTPDTSIAHAASAFRRPCVTLLLPGAEPFAPYCTPGRVVRSPEMQMIRISVDQVTRAIDETLGLLAPREAVSVS